MALMLGGMAVGIIGFSTKSGLSPLPGLVLLPVAICFVVHALGQYYARARAIRRREPGPYEDKNGPVALGDRSVAGGVLEHPHPSWWCRRAGEGPSVSLIISRRAEPSPGGRVVQKSAMDAKNMRPTSASHSA